MATEGRKLLESWKEISAYLNRSVRTCRRWEEILGLPIHRLDGTPSARVFAYADELDGWLQEKLNHVEAEAKQEAASRGRKRMFLLVGAAALATAVIAVTLIWHPFSPAPLVLPTRNVSLAVLPFENSTGEIGFEAWRTALADLLITDLVQSRFVNVVRITDLLRKLVELKLTEVNRFSDADLKIVAEKLGVEYIVTGTLTQDGPARALTVLVRNPRTAGPGRSVHASFRAEDDVFTAADALSAGIKQSLGLSARLLSRDIDRPVSAISTASPQALKLFSQGHRLGGLAKYPESIALLQRAVEVDPEFALAYKQLFRACQNEDRAEDEKKFVRRAMDLSARLSDRERDELEVLFYRYFEKDPAKELETLERLNRTYPEDRFGCVNLLGNYLHHEEWDKALPVAERAWAATKSDINLCRQLARCYSNLGSWDRAERVLSEFIDLNPGHMYWQEALWMRSHASTRLGKFDEALGDIGRLVAEFPNDQNYSLSRGVIFLYKWDFDAAEGEFRKGFSLKEPALRIEPLQLLRDLYLMRGRVGAAIDQVRLALEITDRALKDDDRADYFKGGLRLELARLLRLAGRPAEALEEVVAGRKSYERFFPAPLPLEFSPPLDFLSLEALLLLDLGRQGDFEKRVDEVRELIEQRQTPRLMRICYYLLGHNEMKKGDYQKAVGYFSKAVDLAPPAGNDQLDGADPEYLDSLARACSRADGGLPSRRVFSLYEKISQPSVDRLHSGDIYARSFYEMARYCDAEARDTGQSEEGIKVNRAKAIQSYREFLALWDGADPMFAPLVEDARKRLAVLAKR